MLGEEMSILATGIHSNSSFGANLLATISAFAHAAAAPPLHERADLHWQAGRRHKAMQQDNPEPSTQDVPPFAS